MTGQHVSIRSVDLTRVQNYGGRTCMLRQGSWLQVCADTPIGNEMIRGISGGQKKRVTLGEKLVGPKQVRLTPTCCVRCPDLVLNTG